MQKSLDDITERWKKLKVELTSLETMLKEVIQSWSRYSSCVDLIQAGFAEIESALKTTWSGPKVSIKCYWVRI